MSQADDGTWDNTECTGSPYCPPRCPRFVDARGVGMLARRCEEGDLHAVVEMYADLNPNVRTLGLPPTDPDRIRTWVTSLFEEGWNLIALAGDRVVGHLGVSPSTAAAPELVLFVRGDYQNRGIGTELLKQAVARADDRGHDGLSLVVSKGNRQAVAVFRNVGFEIAERMRGELEMRLQLGPPVTDHVRRPPAER